MDESLEKAERIKHNTYDVVYDYYKKSGNLNNTLKVARKMVESPNSTPVIRGELCECVLTIMMEDFIKKNNLDKKGWFFEKGLILKDLDNPKGEYLTELDFTLFTPKQIYLFECKSYKGDKKFTDECVISVKTNKDTWRKKFDVYAQHIKHYKALFKYLKNFIININSKMKPFKIVCFVFADGEIIDEREDKFKRLFPVLTEKTLYDLFKDYNNRPVYWDIKYVKRAVKIINESKDSLHSEHLDYVTNLDHSNSNSRV